MFLFTALGKGGGFCIVEDGVVAKTLFARSSIFGFISFAYFMVL